MMEVLGWVPARTQLSREDCVKYGGHCWRDDGYSMVNGVGTHIKRQTCKHCPAYRDGKSREAWEWTYPAEQEG